MRSRAAGGLRVNTSNDNGDRDFEQRARALLDESLTHVDSRVRSRLNQARQAALSGIPEHPSQRWRGWRVLPVGLATAAAVAVLAVTTWQHQSTPSVSDEEGDVELMADSEAFALLEDDGAFYAWAVSDEAGG